MSQNSFLISILLLIHIFNEEGEKKNTQLSIFLFCFARNNKKTNNELNSAKYKQYLKPIAIVIIIRNDKQMIKI